MSANKPLINLFTLSGGGRVGVYGAAGGTAKLSGGAVGQLWSLCGAGATQKGCTADRGLPVCADRQR